jgi:hypothetical protein
MHRWILILFTRDIAFPRFSMQEGETWTLGTVAGRTAYLEGGETFVFAGGQCPRSAVRELYRGDDANAAQRIEEEVVMAGPDTKQRRAHAHAARDAKARVASAAARHTTHG